MKKIILIIALVVTLPLAAMAAASTRSIGEQTLDAIDPDKPIIIDFGQAAVNVISWERDYVAVTYTERSIREGLRGDIKTVGNTIRLEGYIAPDRLPTTVSYSVDSWLPLLQLPGHHQGFMTLPEADYTVYVPLDSIIEASGRSLFILGCNVTAAKGDRVNLNASHLLDGFVGQGDEVRVRRSTSEGRASLTGELVVIRESNVTDVTIQEPAVGRTLNVEIRDIEANSITMNALRAGYLNVLVRDIQAESLSIKYDGNDGEIIIRDNIISQLDNQTKLQIRAR